MNVFYNFMDLVKQIPDAVTLIVCPAVLLVAGLILSIFDFKKEYALSAVALGGVGFFLVYCKSTAISFAYLGLFTAWAVLVSLLFLLPWRRKEASAQEELYAEFHRELDILEEEPVQEETIGREECDLRLSHTLDLLEQLKKSELSASDRLETDALSRTVESFRDRELTTSEMRSLNDCLATVLKLTAKYKL